MQQCCSHVVPKCCIRLVKAEVRCSRFWSSLTVVPWRPHQFLDRLYRLRHFLGLVAHNVFGRKRNQEKLNHNNNFVSTQFMDKTKPWPNQSRRDYRPAWKVRSVLWVSACSLQLNNRLHDCALMEHTFTPKSDQFQISPTASPEILHHTV